MASTKVQSALQAAGNSKAFAGNVTAGNLLSARIVWQGAAGITLNSVTDTQGNTWTIHASTLQRHPTLTQYMQQASCVAGSSAACTVTATLSSGTAKSILIDEWNNAGGSLGFDVGTANSGTSPILNSGSATTTAANDLGIGMCAADASLGGAFITPDAGWTDQTNYTPYWYANDLYQLDLGAAGPESAGETLVSGASKNWMANFAAFKVSAGGGSITLAGDNCSQGNVGGAAAVTQAHVLTGANGLQGNTSSAAAATQSHAITGANTSQANTSATGSVIQEHALSGAASAQANDSASGAVTQGASFIGADCDQANTAGSATITQAHALTGAISDQGNVSSGTGITQDHALVASGASQANEGTGGAVILGAVHNLSGEASSQPNGAGTNSITQAHILIHAPSVQDNIAAASAIVQAHVLDAANGVQANLCSAAAIDQTSGIPPVDGPAGSGPRLRLAYGHRPAMRNTSRPRQLR